ncbi:hypothetical protein AB5I41_02935 [Sphingomonas sp. MMS24-JH45]
MKPRDDGGTPPHRQPTISGEAGDTAPVQARRSDPGQAGVHHGGDRRDGDLLAELERRANQGAHLLRSLGLTRGGGIAVMMDDAPHYSE